MIFQIATLTMNVVINVNYSYLSIQTKYLKWEISNVEERSYILSSVSFVNFLKAIPGCNNNNEC
jgi:hypothetical protein